MIYKGNKKPLEAEPLSRIHLYIGFFQKIIDINYQHFCEKHSSDNRGCDNRDSEASRVSTTTLFGGINT
jgi:hypothetical protein